MQDIGKIFNVLGISGAHLEKALLTEVDRHHPDEEAIAALLQAPPPFAIAQSFIDAALHLAISNQKTLAVSSHNTDVCRILLDHGANAEARDVYGETPLLSATRSDLTGMALMLIKKGADVNAQDRHGQTPLMFASNWGNTDVVMQLLAKGARADAVTPDGLTAVIAAGQQGHKDLVRILKAAMPKAVAATSKKQRHPAL